MSAGFSVRTSDIINQEKIIQIREKVWPGWLAMFSNYLARRPATNTGKY